MTIGDSVTSIGDLAFYKCSALTSVTIPDSVTIISNDAFSFCLSLTNVTMESATPPTLGTDVFSITPYDLKIHVPDSTAQGLYQAAANWSDWTIVTP